MRAITVRQPWAWAILHADKDVENRSWTTDYRGPLLIHAAAKKPPKDDVAWLESNGLTKCPEVFELGAIVGMVTLMNVVKYDKKRHADNEYAEGPFLWMLEYPIPFQTPIPFKGQLGFFNVPDELLPDVATI